MAARCGLLAAVMAAAAIGGCPVGQKPARTAFHTNEAYLDALTRRTAPATTDPAPPDPGPGPGGKGAPLEGLALTRALAATDPVSVFAFVLDRLPDRVKVYPTGNYYYFSFVHAGRAYAGNIRLDALNRDSGKVYFAYHADSVPRAEGGAEPDLLSVGVILDAVNEVAVERRERLVYRVTYGRKSVDFALNDLSEVKPPPNAIGPDDKVVGPIFDESGIRFFLVYNSRLKIFHYVLDETVSVLDDFAPSRLTNRIIIGERTGYAFYRDHQLDRKILIGVLEVNRRANNYFDGPFDQLPDNFIEGETLREIILDVEPRLKDQIDRLGRSLDHAWRYTIDPYLHYRKEDDLYIIDMCVTGRRSRPSLYHECFADDNRPSDVRSRPAR